MVLKNYYCYVYLDTRKPGKYKFQDLEFNFKPFYVGKGKNARVYFHLKYVKRRLDKSFRHHFLRTIKKILLENLEPEIVFIKKNMYEDDAYDLETLIIEKIGLDNLTNIFPGGKGGRNNKNFYGRKHTLEAKRKISLSHTGELNPMYGDKYFRSEEGKRSFSEKMSGEKHHFFGKDREKEVKEKISERLKGYKWGAEENKKRSVGMKRVWKYRKENNIKLKNKGTSKRLKLLNLKTNETIIINSQKECSEFFKLDFRTIRKRIEKEELIDNYKILWI